MTFEHLALAAEIMATAKVKATLIGQDNVFSEVMEMSTDLPSDQLGNLVRIVLEEAWHAGEDPVHATIVLTFS